MVFLFSKEFLFFSNLLVRQTYPTSLQDYYYCYYYYCLSLQVLRVLFVSCQVFSVLSSIKEVACHLISGDHVCSLLACCSARWVVRVTATGGRSMFAFPHFLIWRLVHSNAWGDAKDGFVTSIWHIGGKKHNLTSYIRNVYSLIKCFPELQHGNCLVNC